MSVLYQHGHKDGKTKNHKQRDEEAKIEINNLYGVLFSIQESNNKGGIC